MSGGATKLAADGRGDAKALEETTRYDPAEVEGRIFAAGSRAATSTRRREGTPEENFSVAIPPPNVTGALHMGHALNGSIQDALIRMQPDAGPQHALGPRHRPRRDRHPGGGREGARAKRAPRATSSAARRSSSGSGSGRSEYGSQIVEQYKRLGASCDYERERFTLDEGYVRAVYRVFSAALRQGLHLPRQLHGQLGPGLALGDLRPRGREPRGRGHALLRSTTRSRAPTRVLTVATVRPETMLADTAVAVNPDDERYADLVGEHCVLPLVGRRLPIIADEHVDPEFGTGALKITPGHDPNDFEIGRAHGLEEIAVIGEDGRMTEEAGERFAGLTVAEAQEAVRRGAARRGAASAARSPTRTRCRSRTARGERIEPLISLQWFCRMDELAKPAIEVVERDEVRIVPEQLEARLPRLDARRSGPGASRASSGGGTGCRSGTATPARRPSSPRRRRSAAAPAAASCARTRTCSTPGSARRCGRSRRSAGPNETPELRAFYPTDVLVTAREIIFLWVARMVMMGLEFAGDDPVPRRLRPLGDPGARRAADVEEPRHRHRPARRDRRPRRRRAALRAAGDVLDPGRALLGRPRSSRAATSPTRCGTRRG